MHANVILTNKRRTHAQSNYTDRKLKVWVTPSGQETEWAYSTPSDPSHGGLRPWTLVSRTTSLMVETAANLDAD